MFPLNVFENVMQGTSMNITATLAFMIPSYVLAGIFANAIGTAAYGLIVNPSSCCRQGSRRSECPPCHKSLGRWVRELITQQVPYERAAILHRGATQRAREFMRHIEDLLPTGKLWMEEINPVLGAHIGPGVLGFAGISSE